MHVCESLRGSPNCSIGLGVDAIRSGHSECPGVQSSMDAGVIGDRDRERIVFVLGARPVLYTSESQNMRAHISIGSGGVDSPAAVRANDPWRLVSAGITQVFGDGVATSHDQGEGGHGKVTTVRPASSFITGHSPSVACPVGRPGSIYLHDGASHSGVEAMVLSSHVRPRSADAHSVSANMASNGRTNSHHMTGAFLTTEAVSVRLKCGIRSMIVQTSACSERASSSVPGGTGDSFTASSSRLASSLSFSQGIEYSRDSAGVVARSFVIRSNPRAELGSHCYPGGRADYADGGVGVSTVVRPSRAQGIVD